MQKNYPMGNDETRFMLKVKRTISGCWEWSAGKYATGYGQFSVIDQNYPIGDKNRYKNKRAHVFSYETFVGEVPQGLIVRHLCHNRLCVRPEHLEVGTYKENMEDCYDAKRFHNQKKTHCMYGHEFTEENTIYDPNGENGRIKRHCRTCKVARKRWIKPSEAKYMFFKHTVLDKSI